MDQGKKFGSQSKFEQALQAFRKAAEADPLSPDPKYEEGYTLLFLGKYKEAVEAYQKCKELAPGWFNVNFDLIIATMLVSLDLGV